MERYNKHSKHYFLFQMWKGTREKELLLSNIFYKFERDQSWDAGNSRCWKECVLRIPIAEWRHSQCGKAFLLAVRHYQAFLLAAHLPPPLPQYISFILKLCKQCFILFRLFVAPYPKTFIPMKYTCLLFEFYFCFYIFRNSMVSATGNVV